MNKKHYNIRVYGKVQGVFFRASARHHAELLDITGFAQNEDDGSVFLEVEGTEENLKLFLKWCSDGPERAEVTKVECAEGLLKNFKSFDVNRGMF
jgi:acylphosphatase